MLNTIKQSYWVLILAIAMGISSCNRKTVYFHYEHTPIGGWEKNDTLIFNVSPLEAGNYRVEIGIRIDDTFPFKSLCLVINQTILPSGYVLMDTLNCSLIDETGKSKGPGMSVYQYTYHVNTLQLQEGDSLHVTVRHHMKREMMPGVLDIGLRLDKE